MFQTHGGHCIDDPRKTLFLCLVLVKPCKIENHPEVTEKLLAGMQNIKTNKLHKNTINIYNMISNKKNMIPLFVIWILPLDISGKRHSSRHDRYKGSQQQHWHLVRHLAHRMIYKHNTYSLI